MTKRKRIIIFTLLLIFSCFQMASADDNGGNGDYQNFALKGNTMLLSHTNYSKGVEEKRIVIDPGHGGSDTGAIGVGGTQEKNVTLAISLELRNLLEKNKAKVLLTRQTDKDVYGLFAPDDKELQARADIANHDNADLFISIHIDSYMNALAGGTTTYYFADTAQNEQLAQSVQEGLAAQLKLEDRGCQVKDFYVLSHTEMPAILTEVAYISNPEEEKLLNNRTFIHKAATGIYQGIVKYFGEK